MTTGFGILFAITSLFPGFFLFNFFKDAFGEYKRTGKYFWSTLLSSPGLFFVSQPRPYPACRAGCKEPSL